MLINDPNMPNPLLILGVFAFSLAIVRVLTTTIHEMGHALVGLVFFKGNFDVYVGSYGDPEKGTHFKIGRIRFHFIYDPFSIEKGLFRAEEQSTTHLRNFLMILGGPLASLMSVIVYSYIIAFYPIPELAILVLSILIGSSALDVYYNLKPGPNPTELYDGKIVYNDGYMLKYCWSQMFGKGEQQSEES